MTYTETPTDYALIPGFLLEGLEVGTLDLTGLVLWVVLRFHAPDQKPGTFSPPPVALTNRKLARMTRLSRRHVINVLNDLEAGGWVHRLTQEEKDAAGLQRSRWLQLTRPDGVNSSAVQSVSEGGEVQSDAVKSTSGAASSKDPEDMNSGAVQPISPQTKRLTAADRYIPGVQSDREVERYG